MTSYSWGLRRVLRWSFVIFSAVCFTPLNVGAEGTSKAEVGAEIEGLQMTLVGNLYGKFKLQMPGTPIKEVKNLVIQGEDVKAYEYTVSLSRERNYIFSWRDLPERFVKDRDPRAVIDAYHSQYIRRVDRVKRRTEIVLKGSNTPGIDWECEIDSQEFGEVHLRDVMYLNGRRLYRIACIGDARATDYVLYSFHLTDEEREKHFERMAGNWTVISSHGWHEPHQLKVVYFERNFYKCFRAKFENDRPYIPPPEGVVRAGGQPLSPEDLYERRDLWIVPEKDGGSIDFFAASFQRDDLRGIYRFSGDEMSIHLNRGKDAPRPTSFDEKPADGAVVLRLKR